MIWLLVKEQDLSLAASNEDAAAAPGVGRADDFALMAGISARDRAAFERLYDRHSPLVLALCDRVLHDRAEAEDVMVDVFWEVWDRADRYDPRRGSPLTYLTTLARSRAIDRKRSKGKAPPPVDLGATEPVTAPTADNPERGAVADESRALVKRALLGLDPDQRQAIECAFYDGLTHTEIAEKLGKPLGTVKTWIRQGLIRLRDSLRITNGGDA